MKKGQEELWRYKGQKSQLSLWMSQLNFLSFSLLCTLYPSCKNEQKGRNKSVRKKEKRLSPDTFSQVCHSFLQLAIIIFDSVPDITKSHKTTSNAGYYWIFADIGLKKVVQGKEDLKVIK